MVFVVFNLAFGAFSRVTDNAAHIGGLITGLILGSLTALLAPQQDQAPRRAAIFLVALLVLAGGATELAHHYGLPLRLGRAPFARTTNLIPQKGLDEQGRRI
jgi:hypothetical protein